ncbi:hypothetical protein EDC94DRAFT_613730 [Helicostylum pulchrum]|nr:hypothetical protein EDC94DRAFT_613730 [Helicostylum pulchrum]
MYRISSTGFSFLAVGLSVWGINITLFGSRSIFTFLWLLLLVKVFNFEAKRDALTINKINIFFMSNVNYKFRC